MADFNPARLSELINRHASLFTSAISYSTIGDNFIRALNNNWVTQAPLSLTYIGAVILMLATAAIAAAFCLSLGNFKMRRLCVYVSSLAALLGLAGTAFLRFVAYNGFTGALNPERINPMLPTGIAVYFFIFTVMLLFSTAIWLTLPRVIDEKRFEMPQKYKLFLMILPFLVLVALFAYLPLWGWRVSFFNYRPGFELSMDDWVGFRWVEFLFTNPAIRADIGRVLTNTFAMSGLGLLFSWLPIVFAVFLSEMRTRKGKRIIQTFTTIPNFISWVLVYSVAFALFSSEGFVNWVLMNLGLVEEGTNFLMNNGNVWFTMWLWSTWKGLGWGAIIYIASISGIDPQLYEAATVDGAGRFKKMWHVTVPGLIPTFFVLLLLSISNILSNGLDQYLVFSNANNRPSIEVLDLYVYNLGLGDGAGGTLPLATLIGMLKSIISVTLLFGANAASKLIRGESIV